MELRDLYNKYEFVYKINNSYYIIGMNDCRKTDDVELIELYNKWVELTNDEEFINYDKRSINKSFCKTVCDYFMRILDICKIQQEEDNMTFEKHQLREKIINTGDNEIIEKLTTQLEVIEKNYDCFDYLNSPKIQLQNKIRVC